MASSSIVPQALGMEKRPQLQPGGCQAGEIMEINGPLTPKVPLINDLHRAAKWLLPRSPEPSRRQKAQSKHQGRGSFMFSQQQEHLLSFSPVLLQSLLACLPTRWKLAQPSPQLTPETSPVGFGEGGDTRAHGPFSASLHY